MSPVEHTSTSAPDTERSGDRLGGGVRGLEPLGAGEAVRAAGVQHDRADHAIRDHLLRPDDRVGLRPVAREHRGGVLQRSAVHHEGEVEAAAST